MKRNVQKQRKGGSLSIAVSSLRCGGRLTPPNLCTLSRYEKEEELRGIGRREGGREGGPEGREGKCTVQLIGTCL